MKRSVNTDALDTIGTIIDERAGRDAIHLAVEPAVAGHTLNPGAPVVIGDDGRAYCARPGIGIVDPFLEQTVVEGQRFWLVVMPRTVTSLRHVWSHPAFPDEPTLAGLRSRSETWLRDFIARDLDLPPYDQVLAEIMQQEKERYLIIHGVSGGGDLPEEFWHHIEIVLGHPVVNRASSWSCSC